MGTQFLDKTGLQYFWSLLKNKFKECRKLIVITEDMVTVTTDATKGVSPYNTGYGYTNITVNLSKELLVEGVVILPVVKSTMVVSSSYRNVRIRFGSDDAWHPVMATNGVLAGSSYFILSQFREYVYTFSYRTEGGFHLVSDANTTYSTYSLGIGYGTCTTAAETAAKAVTLASYSLVKGGIISVKFTYSVPANATMNVNSKGAKPIWYKGSAIKSGVIANNDLATFIYDGTNYQLISLDNWESYVPTSRTINGKALTSNITIEAEDIGAAHIDHSHDDIYITRDEMRWFSTDESLAGNTPSSGVQRFVNRAEMRWFG